jgi:hypothetical protein
MEPSDSSQAEAIFFCYDLEMNNHLLEIHNKSSHLRLILGLCGSGKSYAIERLQEADPELRMFDEGVFHDDVRCSKVRAALREGRRCAIADCRLLSEEGRRDALERLAGLVSRDEIQWVCFENDTETANHNCRVRRNKGFAEDHIRLNELWTREYTYPAGAVPLPVFRLPLG